MTSPLATCEEIKKEFNVTSEKELHPRAQLGFVDEQITQQQHIMNRAVIDLAVARTLLKVATPEAKSAIGSKVAAYENDLRQISRGIVFYIELKKELEANVAKDAAV